MFIQVAECTKQSMEFYYECNVRNYMRESGVLKAYTFFWLQVP